MRFIDQFPTVFDLANASEGQVLKIWQGLGYYSRARNLHYSSKIIVEKHLGKFPENHKDILELFEKDENPIGGYIRIDDIYFQVIGVHKYIEGGGFESDGDVFIPFSTYKKLYNTGDNVDWLTIAAYDDADVVAVEEQVKQTLKRIHI